jgi:hypothetical protein
MTTRQDQIAEESVTHFIRMDYVIVLGIFVVALAMRVPLRSELAFHWDSAQYALAIEHYDISRSLPHAPGYFLYVMLGRLVNLFVREPHESLVWMSVVFGSALPTALYLLGASMFSRPAGIAAAAIGATSLMTWFHSLIAMTYVVDAFYVTVFALLCWRARQQGVGWRDVTVLSALLAVILGTRAQSGVTLVPLWLYALWGARERRRHKILVAAVLASVFVLAWFVPMLGTVGGLGRYVEIARAHVSMQQRSTVLGGGPGAVFRNLSIMSRFVTAGLLVGAIVLAAGYLWRVRYLAQVLRRRRRDDRVWFYLIWLGPMILFWSVFYTYVAGHVLSYFCGVAVLTGAATAIVAREISERVKGIRQKCALLVLTAGMVGVNAWGFLFRPRFVDAVTAEPLTWRDVRAHDERLAGAIRLIRAKFPPDNVLLCHADEFLFWGFRHFQYYLPEYRNVLLVRDPSLPGDYAHKLWLGHDRATEFIDSIEGYRQVTRLLVVPPGWTLSIFRQVLDLRDAEPVKGSAGTLYKIIAAPVRERTSVLKKCSAG